MSTPSVLDSVPAHSRREKVEPRYPAPERIAGWRAEFTDAPDPDRVDPLLFTIEVSSYAAAGDKHIYREQAVPTDVAARNWLTETIGTEMLGDHDVLARVELTAEGGNTPPRPLATLTGTPEQVLTELDAIAARNGELPTVDDVAGERLAAAKEVAGRRLAATARDLALHVTPEGIAAAASQGGEVDGRGLLERYSRAVADAHTSGLDPASISAAMGHAFEKADAHRGVERAAAALDAAMHSGRTLDATALITSYSEAKQHASAAGLSSEEVDAIVAEVIENGDLERDRTAESVAAAQQSADPILGPATATDPTTAASTARTPAWAAAAGPLTAPPGARGPHIGAPATTSAMPAAAASMTAQVHAGLGRRL